VGNFDDVVAQHVVVAAAAAGQALVSASSCRPSFCLPARREMIMLMLKLHLRLSTHFS